MQIPWKHIVTIGDEYERDIAEEKPAPSVLDGIGDEDERGIAVEISAPSVLNGNHVRLIASLLRVGHPDKVDQVLEIVGQSRWDHDVPDDWLLYQRLRTTYATIVSEDESLQSISRLKFARMVATLADTLIHIRIGWEQFELSLLNSPQGLLLRKASYDQQDDEVVADVNPFVAMPFAQTNPTTAVQLHIGELTRRGSLLRRLAN